MGIQDARVVDAIGIDTRTGRVVLSIIDGETWSGDVLEHLFLIQEKLNSYLAFRESGEIYSVYPNAKGRDLVISIVSREAFPDQAEQMLSRMRGAIGNAGFSLIWSIGEGQTIH